MSSFFRKMLTTLSRNKRTERMVGRDHFGNQYFEGVTYRDGGPKVVRRLEPAKGKDIYDFIGTENIPPLWNSWLRYYREDPPSDQEIEDDMKATLMRCQKIAEMEKLEQQRRAERELLTRTYKDVKIEKSDKVMAEASEKFTFFYETESPFSQFHPSYFKIDGVEYSCAEQYMMHQKAVLFCDKAMADNIMAATVPKDMKAFGRKVSNFDINVWNEKCRDIVKQGNIAKFSQNPELQKELFSTAGTVLVEASPRDNIWGIGLGAKNPKALNKSTWRGKNWLGYALTEVREELMKTNTVKS